MTVTTVGKLWLFGWTTIQTNLIYKNWWIFNGWGILGDTWAIEHGFADEQYQIIDTDYRNYAVTYGCTTWGLFLYHTFHAQLLSRKEVLDEVYLKMASDKLMPLAFNTQKQWT